MAKIQVTFTLESPDLKATTLRVIIRKVLFEYTSFTRWIAEWWYQNMILMGNWADYESSKVARPRFTAGGLHIEIIENPPAAEPGSASQEGARRD